MTFLEELSLLLASKGIPPDMVAALLTRIEAGGALLTDVATTTVNRNLAVELEAKTRAVMNLFDIARELPDLADAIRELAVKVVENAEDLVSGMTGGAVSDDDEEPPEVQ